MNGQGVTLGRHYVNNERVVPLGQRGRDQLMVGVSRQDNIFVGERVMPLLHLQWTTIVDIHLVILGGVPQQATIITPQGVFTKARI